MRCHGAEEPPRPHPHSTALDSRYQEHPIRAGSWQWRWSIPRHLYLFLHPFSLFSPKTPLHTALPEHAIGSQPPHHTHTPHLCHKMGWPLASFLYYFWVSEQSRACIKAKVVAEEGGRLGLPACPPLQEPYTDRKPVLSTSFLTLALTAQIQQHFLCPRNPCYGGEKHNTEAKS